MGGEQDVRGLASRGVIVGDVNCIAWCRSRRVTKAGSYLWQDSRCVCVSCILFGCLCFLTLRLLVSFVREGPLAINV